MALAGYQAGLEKWRQGDMDSAIPFLSGAQSSDPNDEAIRRDLTRFRKERECVGQAGSIVAEADHAGEAGDWERAFRIYEWVLQTLSHKDTDFAARVRTKLATARLHLPWKTDEERADLERRRDQAREDADRREREAARMEANRRYWERVNREAEKEKQERRERLAKMLDDGVSLLKLSGSSSGSEGAGELSFERPSDGSQAATEPKLQFPPIEAPRRLFEPGDQNPAPVVPFGQWPHDTEQIARERVLLKPVAGRPRPAR